MSDAWERRLKLLSYLMRKGFAQTKDAANFLDVERRKAREDLVALSEHGVPLTVHPEDPTDPDRTWQLEKTWRMSGVEVRLPERLALLLGREVLEPLVGKSEVGEAMDNLEQKLSAMAGGVELSDSNLLRRFHLIQEPSKDYSDRGPLVSELVQAVAHSYRVTVTYQTPSAKAPRVHARVRPLTLAIYRRGLYVFVAFGSDLEPGDKGLKFDKIGPLSVDRIASLEPHPDALFDYPPLPKWDPARDLRHRFGLAPGMNGVAQVRLRFGSSSRAYALERQWMPDQRVEESPDGGVDVVFEAEGSELAHHIVGWGGYCEVVEPASLRAQVIALAEAVLARHGKGG
jgi:predicted DNA-binding transcriptional regulator YafY